jgi:hypothetical protein
VTWGYVCLAGKFCLPFPPSRHHIARGSGSPLIAAFLTLSAHSCPGMAMPFGVIRPFDADGWKLEGPGPGGLTTAAQAHCGMPGGRPRTYPNARRMAVLDSAALRSRWLDTKRPTPRRYSVRKHGRFTKSTAINSYQIQRKNEPLGVDVACRPRGCTTAGSGVGRADASIRMAELCVVGTDATANVIFSSPCLFRLLRLPSQSTSAFQRTIGMLRESVWSQSIISGRHPQCVVRPARGR